MQLSWKTRAAHQAGLALRDSFFIFIPRSPSVFLLRLVFLGGKGLGWVFSKVFWGSVN